jgi:hypothetical protein
VENGIMKISGTNYNKKTAPVYLKAGDVLIVRARWTGTAQPKHLSTKHDLANYPDTNRVEGMTREWSLLAVSFKDISLPLDGLYVHNREAGDGYEISDLYIGNSSYLTPIIDNSGNGRCMYIAKGVVPAPGPGGRSALKFLGTGGALTKYPEVTFYPAGNFTWSLWANKNKAASTTYQYLLANVESGGVGIRAETDGRLAVLAFSNGEYKYLYIPAAKAPDNTDLHLILKYNSATKTLLLKINNVEEGRITLPAAIAWPSVKVPLAMGGNPVNSQTSLTQNFYGSLSDVAVFARLTAEAEDRALYQAPLPKRAISAADVVTAANGKAESLQSALERLPFPSLREFADFATEREQSTILGRQAANLMINKPDKSEASVTAIGARALHNSQDGFGDTAVGCEAGSERKSNGWGANTLVGYGAGKFADGQENVCIGFDAGKHSKGFSNVFVGNGAGGSRHPVEDGSQFRAGENRNTIVGNDSYRNKSLSATLLNCSALGNGAAQALNGPNQVQLGNSATTVYAYGPVQNRSDARDKTDVRDTLLGLEFISRLRPVDFRWDLREDYIDKGIDEETGAPYVDEKEPDGSRSRRRFHHGLIAQELKKVLDEMGVDFGGYQDHKVSGGGDRLTLGYDEFIGPLIKAAQELGQQNKDLLARIEKLEAKNA